MRRRVSSGGGGGGRRQRIPNQDEDEILPILLSLQKLSAKSKVLKRYTFTWGRKKKRSALVSKSQSKSKSKSNPSNRRRNCKSIVSIPEKVTVAEADKSPSTPLCFIPSGSGSDGADKPKQQSSSKKKLKKKKLSALISKSESNPSNHRKNYKSRPEKVTAAEADKSSSTPLNGNGGDGPDKPQQRSSSKKNSNKKRKISALISKSESHPSNHRRKCKSRPEKVTAGEADKSPSTPLSFSPSRSGSNAADKPKQRSSTKKNSKKKGTDELIIEKYNKLKRQRKILKRKIKAMESVRQELRDQNLKLKAKGQEINYSRNIEGFPLWNNGMKWHLDQHYHQQITMFPHPPLPPPPPHSMVSMPPCCSNSNGGSGHGLFNHIDPRVRIHGEAFGFMGSSQPFDQSKYLRAMTAAAARKRRIMRMKEIKNPPPPPPPPPQPPQQCQQCMVDANNSQPFDQNKHLRVMAAAAARKRRIMKMKEIKNPPPPRPPPPPQPPQQCQECVTDADSGKPAATCSGCSKRDDLRAKTTAAARKRRIMRLKENRKLLLAMKLARECR